MRPSPPAVILLSGGLDSATTLAVARRDGFVCHTMCFDYGQRHRHEIASAARVARDLGAATHRVVRINLRDFGGSALTADIEVPKAGTRHQAPGTRPEPESIPVTYVPARNLVFLSLGVALAETLGARAIYIGVNAVDYSGYPDCRPEFVASFQRTANLGTKAGVEGHGCEIRAPLVAMSKAEIIRLGVQLGVDYGHTHSCYDPVMGGAGETLACGRCDSCRLRRDGFREAGVPDPTRYA
jgi:7-cyano-7-deazaguanine synthase